MWQCRQRQRQQHLFSFYATFKGIAVEDVPGCGVVTPNQKKCLLLFRSRCFKKGLSLSIPAAKQFWHSCRAWRLEGWKFLYQGKKNKTTKKLLHAQRVNFLKVCTQRPFFPRHYSGKKTRCDKCVKVSPCSQQGQLEDDLRAAHFTVCLCCRLNFAEAICIHTSFHILSFQKK